MQRQNRLDPETRTVVCAEKQVIQADDLRMEVPETYSDRQNPPSPMTVHAAPRGTGQPEERGERQGNMRGDARKDRQTNARFLHTADCCPATMVISGCRTRALDVLLERKTLTCKENLQIVDDINAGSDR
jgi:hypothetical protein